MFQHWLHHVTELCAELLSATNAVETDSYLVFNMDLSSPAWYLSTAVADGHDFPLPGRTSHALILASEACIPVCTPQHTGKQPGGRAQSHLGGHHDGPGRPTSRRSLPEEIAILRIHVLDFESTSAGGSGSRPHRSPDWLHLQMQSRRSSSTTVDRSPERQVRGQYPIRTAPTVREQVLPLFTFTPTATEACTWWQFRYSFAA